MCGRRGADSRSIAQIHLDSIVITSLFVKNFLGGSDVTNTHSHTINRYTDLPHFFMNKLVITIESR